MATMPQKRLVAYSRVTIWGFLVALLMALAFCGSGLRALAVDVFAINVTPRNFGIFVEPPAWLIGGLLLAFAAFLFLVGISELARYLKPSAEIVIDGDGIASFGLLGERRFAWRDLIAVDAGSDQVSLKVRGKGRVPPPDVRIHFDRLDIDRGAILSTIWANRPDLLPKRFSSVDA